MQSHQYCQQKSRGNQIRNQAKLNTFGRRSENRDSQKRALWNFDIIRQAQGRFSSRSTSTCFILCSKFVINKTITLQL